MVEIGRNAILYLLLLILGFSAGYFLKSTTTAKQAVVENSPVKETKENKIPECFAGRCPQYFEMTVDKDWGSSASVVIIPTAMTQGAGKVMIIKKGKVILETPEMPGIGIDNVDDGDGFILHYSSPRDENLNNVQYSVRYRYRDGKFVEDRAK